MLARRAALALAAGLIISASGAHAQSSARTATPEATLAAYRDALETLNVTKAGELFARDSQIVESGKVEGTWAEYLSHHLGPELGDFAAFKFDDYKAKVRRLGNHAWSVETYTYRITLKEKREVVERQAVATSLLRREGGGWKIVHQHVSSRRPPAKP